jgi:hypothetical protein
VRTCGRAGLHASRRIWKRKSPRMATVGLKGRCAECSTQRNSSREAEPQWQFHTQTSASFAARSASFAVGSDGSCCKQPQAPNHRGQENELKRRDGSRGARSVARRRSWGRYGRGYASTVASTGGRSDTLASEAHDRSSVPTRSAGEQPSGLRCRRAPGASSGAVRPTRHPSHGPTFLDMALAGASTGTAAPHALHGVLHQTQRPAARSGLSRLPPRKPEGT